MKLIKASVPTDDIPQGAIVKNPSTNQVFIKTGPFKYRRMDILEDDGELIATGDDSPIQGNLDVFFVPKESALADDLQGQLGEYLRNLEREGKEVDNVVLNKLGQWSFTARENARRLLGDTREVDDDLLNPLFPTMKFEEVPNGATVIHPRNNVPHTKRGDRIERVLQSGFHGSPIDPNTDVTVFVQNPIIPKTQEAA